MARKPTRYFVVDAFTDSAFKGNPAAVCILTEEQDEVWLQSVAREFNLSETCYLTKITDSRYRLRWFTPVAEVLLCGHATLASAHALFSSGLVKCDMIEFDTLSGILSAKRVSEGEEEAFSIELNFPIVPTMEYNSADAVFISRALNGATVLELEKTTTEDDFLVVLPSGKDVADLQPDFDKIEKCPGRGIIVTGVGPPESGFDFTSRFFCPKFGIKEDPVTGSVHCALAPHWSKKLGKTSFVAYQASARGGVLKLHLDEQNQRVHLQGKAVTMMEGSLLV